MKFFTKAALGLCMAASASFSGSAVGWPADYEGVMLQGFYWDSYQDTRWTTLESQADELSQYFKLIWIPNSGSCGGGNNMGYMPQYWFTNHNSSFGTETQLRSMINTFKAKGTGIIADVVINHRVGISNWTDFPAEKWRGQTWKIGLDGICSTDEVSREPGQAKPTGAPDTGEDFNGARDLDHTNLNVQNNCKNYCKCLLEDFGYAGFRYDMVKGYGGQYTKIYNQYSKPTYSVGEYWDGSYDAVKGWIEATGKESAAFDFPCKYAINEAFGSNDMTKLVWRANGTTEQPAGLIHFGYSQYSVTFVDNHDTYRDGSKFNGNVVAANAFILFSPGTPCVFLPHYKANKQAIQTLIKIRNAVGIHNNSAVKVLKSSRDCYMAEVTGKKGKAVVKVGSSMDSPAGYSNNDIKASGNGYCVWTTTDIGGGGGGGDDPLPGDKVTIYFNNANSNWTTPYIHYWNDSDPSIVGSTWPGVAMSKVDGAVNIWKYDCPAGINGCLFNAGDGDATKTSDFVAVHNHVYTTAGDQGEYNGGGGGGGGGSTAPQQLYILGNLEGASWMTDAGKAMTKEGDCFVARNVKFELPLEAADENVYFTFVTALGADWDVVNTSGDRYGAPSKDYPLTVGVEGPMAKYTLNVNCSAAESWKIPVGEYNITANFANMTVKVEIPSSGVGEIEAAGEDVAPVYYNLQGVRVENPANGLYIVVRGNKVAKEYVK